MYVFWARLYGCVLGVLLFVWLCLCVLCVGLCAVFTVLVCRCLCVFCFVFLRDGGLRSNAFTHTHMCIRKLTHTYSKLKGDEKNVVIEVWNANTFSDDYIGKAILTLTQLLGVFLGQSCLSISFSLFLSLFRCLSMSVWHSFSLSVYITLCTHAYTHFTHSHALTGTAEKRWIRIGRDAKQKTDAGLLLMQCTHKIHVVGYKATKKSKKIKVCMCTCLCAISLFAYGVCVYICVCGFVNMCCNSHYCVCFYRRFLKYCKPSMLRYVYVRVCFRMCASELN